MGWATGELTAGVMEGGFERSTAAYLFDVTITLTEAGLHAGPGEGRQTLAQSCKQLACMLIQASVLPLLQN